MNVRKILFTGTILFATLFSLNAQTWDDILKTVAKAISGQTSSYKDVTTKTLIVNSSSNARMMGGKTRAVIKIDLPENTDYWFYRVTVLDKNSNYSYSNNESFYYLLSHNKKMNLYSPTSEGIEFFVLGHSGDVNSFLETGNNNFRVFADYSRINTGSCVGQCKLNQENLWIGIKNPNTSTGLQVIVEVVAWGRYN